jgi:hypothetical protein
MWCGVVVWRGALGRQAGGWVGGVQEHVLCGRDRWTRVLATQTCSNSPRATLLAVRRHHHRHHHPRPHRRHRRHVLLPGAPPSPRHSLGSYYTDSARNTSAEFKAAGYEVYINFDGRITPKLSSFVPNFSLMSPSTITAFAQVRSSVVYAPHLLRTTTTTAAAAAAVTTHVCSFSSLGVELA